MKLITIDLEDWYSTRVLSSFSNIDWDSSLPFVEQSTERLLVLFKKYNIQACFFVLGYISHRHPDLIRRIADHGHEIASHGYNHEHLAKLNPTSFAEDIEKSLNALAEIGFTNVRGYRAPSFSFTEKTLWAPDVLSKFGFQFSSSVYPTNVHPDYGLTRFGFEPFRYDNGLLEIPMNSAQFGRRLIPCSGGAYLRFFPFPLFKYLIGRSALLANHYIFYLHPWELSSDQPRISGNTLQKIRHYYNIHKVEQKLEKLLSDISFDEFSPSVSKLIHS